MLKIIFFSIFFLSTSFFAPMEGQTFKKDTIFNKKSKKLKALIIPTLLIGYGAVSLSNKHLRTLDLSIYTKLNNPEHGKIRLDNFTQFVPIVTVYGLNVFGVKGIHNFKDRTIIFGNILYNYGKYCLWYRND